uniref:Cyclin-like domain-containing protein n=1 Tax=Ditylenchus dipsaci TaxID=166011 RepID=A0A915D7N5_9BILA
MQKIKPSEKYSMKRTYSTIDISADKWLLINDPNSLAKLENPPSLADGISREMEKDLRYLGCELIQSGAILLKLPQTAAATGQILFQRYYYQRSFVRCNLEHTVMACLLLASKIEEEPRRPRDIINVYNRLKQLHNRRYSANPDKKLEHLTLDQNYVCLKNCLNMLESKEMLQKAWSYMNDGLRTDIFLRYRPETIACACIHLAARTIDNPVVLPKAPFPWFELFDASDRDVKAICQVLLELYTINETPRLSRLSAYSSNGSLKSSNDPKKILSEKAEIPLPPTTPPRKGAPNETEVHIAGTRTIAGRGTAPPKRTEVPAKNPQRSMIAVQNRRNPNIILSLMTL